MPKTDILSTTPHILLVDDDIAVTTSLKLLCKQAGFHIVVAHHPTEAVKHVQEMPIQLVILDMNFSRSTTGEEGLRALHSIRQVNPDLPVILMTAWGSIPLAVEGMKAGASDFLTKPWNNEHLLNTIHTVLELSKKSSTEGKQLNRQQLDRQFDFDTIIGCSPEFLTLLQTVGRIAKTDASVLITGESGTGKEVIAEAIHRNSPRHSKPFVKVNLGGIPTTLFESELFGHARGAFTDARQDRIGRFEMAHTGTIFLDEIGELELQCQVKLLRVLQERQFEVLGSSVTKTVDVRLISATNRQPETMVARNEFREDLLYRINLISLKMPALRERSEDIPLFVTHYIDTLKMLYDREALQVSQGAMKWLKELSWPGNIRELKNLVERAVLVSDKDMLEQEDFVAHLYHTQKAVQESLPAIGTMTLEEIEESMIKKALDFYDGNVSKAARALDLSRGALYRRMERYGISL